MCLFLGISLIVMAVIQVVFMKKIFEFHEKWKYNGEAEMSDDYVFTQLIGAGICVIIGLCLIFAYIVKQLHFGNC